MQPNSAWDSALIFGVQMKFILLPQLKKALSGLRQFLAAESSLKMMYFTSKAFFVLKIFKFLSWRFGHVAKRLDKDKVNFKFYCVAAWLWVTIPISRSKGNPTLNFWSVTLIECNIRNIFLEKSYICKMWWTN